MCNALSLTPSDVAKGQKDRFVGTQLLHLVCGDDFRGFRGYQAPNGGVGFLGKNAQPGIEPGLMGESHVS